MLKKQLLLLSILVLAITSDVFAQKQKTEAFQLQNVRLLSGPFKEAEQVDLNYILKLNPDKLLAPFLIDAGIEPKAERYTNWENTGLDGHTAGHYLTALALMYASVGSEEANQRLTYMVNELAKCQQKNGNGYVGGVPQGNAMWKEVASGGKLEVDNFSINKKWVPWYNLHKLYAGLRDAYLYAGNSEAKDVLIKLCDWCILLTSKLSDDDMQRMLSAEHGGMNEVFADVYVMTGDKKYLEMAKRFSHQAILTPLLKHEDKLTGLHANTQIPKVIGFEKIGQLTSDTLQTSAAAFFWETVVNNRSVSIGGNSVREHFHPSNNFSSMIESKEGPESCNTYNMLKLSKELYTSTGALKYIDYYERALYNHILSSQHPGDGGFVYFTSMRPRHYRVYSQPQQGFWCCVGSGMENHGKYGELIYAHNNENLFVNLFIASQLEWKEKGVKLVQETNFPDQEKSILKLTMKSPETFTLNIRYPSWVKAGSLKISVNGKTEKILSKPSSYVQIKRKWMNGDVITIQLPMETTAQYLPDHSPWVSFMRGPIVLASKTDTTDLTGLKADDSRMGHIANGNLYSIDTAPMIVTDDKNLAAKIKPVKNKTLTFTAPELIYPKQFKDLELIPFYRLHDARYVIYWNVTTPAELKKIQQAARDKEIEKMALESRTIDQVAPGEQQPESDHNFKAEKSESGIHMDRHWRHAFGWFSYDLKDKNKEAEILQVTYFGADRNRVFDIFINGTLLATQNLDGSKGNNFFTVDYKIPREITQNSTTLNVKFEAHKESIAGGIFYLRLLKK